MLAITSIVRHASPDQQSSYLTLVDSVSGQVLARYALPEAAGRARDPNPRGGMRGARGLAVMGMGLAIATGDRIFVTDRAGKLVREVSHPLAGGIHDISAAANGFWVAATASNFALLFSEGGDLLDSWHPCSDDGVRNALGIPTWCRPDPSLDYRDPTPGIAQHDLTHLNGMIVSGSHLLVSLGQVLPRHAIRGLRLRAGAVRAAANIPVLAPMVARLRSGRETRLLEKALPAPTKDGGFYAIAKVPLRTGKTAPPGKILWRKADAKTPKHNLVASNGQIAYADSDRGAVVWIDTSTGNEVHAVDVPGSPPFARGLCELADGSHAVGSQRPLSVSVIDPTRQRTRTFSLPGHKWETSYSVTELPASHSSAAEGLASWCQHAEV